MFRKHVIYFTVFSGLILGLSIGLVLATKGFEPRPEYEIMTTFKKIELISFFIIYASIYYLAGTEYHELKRRIKSD